MAKTVMAIKEISKFYPISERGFRKIRKETDADMGVRRLGGKLVVIKEIFEDWLVNNKVTNDD